MTELVPGQPPKGSIFQRFPYWLCMATASAAGCWLPGPLLQRACEPPDDYGDRPRIARRATVDKSASMAPRQKSNSDAQIAAAA
jgi:hypothetical protein